MFGYILKFNQIKLYVKQVLLYSAISKLCIKSFVGNIWRANHFDIVNEDIKRVLIFNNLSRLPTFFFCKLGYRNKKLNLSVNIKWCRHNFVLIPYELIIILNFRFLLHKVMNTKALRYFYRIFFHLPYPLWYCPKPGYFFLLYIKFYGL